MDSDRVDAGEGRGFSAQAGKEGFEMGRRAFDFDGDAAGIIADRACEILFSRQPIDEGTEADTLDDAADLDGTTCPGLLRVCV